MTVIYTHKVATGSRLFGNFRKLLIRWAGSVYKLIIPELCVYVVLFYVISIPYRLFLAHKPDKDTSKFYFHVFVRYSRDAAGTIPLQFILGFYVSQVVSRWWNTFMSIPWPDTIAVSVASSVRGHDDRGRLIRRTILRYMNLSLNMVFTMLSPQARSRFPTLDDVVDGGFLVPHERLIIEHLNEKTPGPKYYVPCVWAGAVAVKARRENRIKDDVALYQIIKEICRFRQMCQDLLSYDWICIPLVYTQVATLATYIYFFSSLLGKQFIVEPEPEMVDIYVPIFLFLEFTFMMGWLKVAETMLNPFGEDDDDFEVNWLMDRNITVSYLIVDEMNNEFPEMLKDAYWDNVIPEELPYTLDSLKYKTEGMGEGSAAKQDEAEVSPHVSTHNRFSLFHLNIGTPLKDPKAEIDSPQRRNLDGSGELVTVAVSQLLEHDSAPDYKDSLVSTRRSGNDMSRNS